MNKSDPQLYGLNLNHYTNVAGADQYRHSSSKRVNIKFVDESLAFNDTCSDTKFHVYILSYASSTRKRRSSYRTWTKSENPV